MKLDELFQTEPRLRDHEHRVKPCTHIWKKPVGNHFGLRWEHATKKFQFIPGFVMDRNGDRVKFKKFNSSRSFSIPSKNVEELTR